MSRLSSLGITAVCALVFLSAERDSGARISDFAQVDVMVEDGNGKPVSGLLRDDFEVWSDGQRRPIDTFSPPSATTPLTLVVLVDISASQLNCDVKVVPEPTMITAGRGIPRSSPMVGLSGGWGEFVLDGFRSTDRVQVGSVGRRIAMSGRFSQDLAEIKRDWRALFAVPPVEGLGPSPIWDAVDEAATALARETGHRAIVLITDGQASGNTHGSREVSRRAALAGIPVSIVAEESMLPTYPSLTTMASHGIDPTYLLRAMADLTGGGFAQASAELSAPEDRCFSRDPAPVFKRVLDQLHQAYLLGFVPQGGGGKAQTLDVRVTKPGVVVRARRIL